VNRINVALTLVLVVCALGLVTSQHRARKLFIDLERAQNQARQLEVQWEQLVLEQTGLSKASLIDAKARRGLAMQPVPAERTMYLTLEPGAERTAAR
jgi:cell division protein FtsL